MKNTNSIDREYNDYIIYGNTVKKLYESEKINKNKSKNKAINKKSNVMNLASFVLMLSATLIASYLCINYIRSEVLLENKIKSISSLEKNLKELIDKNDAKAAKINESINLDEILNVATQKFGMVYANKNQIIRYDKTESEYVRQYEDIPSK